METEIKYSSDLTNRQWQLIRQLMPRRSRRGRKPIERRRIINAVLYVVRTSCQWRMLPKDFPNWSTFYPRASQSWSVYAQNHDLPYWQAS